eukprot:tig00000498_g1664.t1
MLLFHVCLPLTVERYSPRAAARAATKAWLRLERRGAQGSGGAPRHRAPRPARRGGRPGPAGGAGPAPAAGEANEAGEASGGGGGGALSRGRVWLAACALVCAAVTSLVLLSCSLIALPVGAGRALVRAVGIPLSHDVYTGFLGGYFLWGLHAACQALARQRSLVHAAGLALRRGVRLLLAASLAALWLLLAPLLAGLLVELTLFTPLRVPLNQTPLLYQYQTWAVGLLCVKVWLRLCLAEAAGGPDNPWRARFQRVMNDGLANLRPWLTFREVILPVVAALALALSLPLVLARTILPLLAADGRVLLVAERYGHLAGLGLAGGCLCAGRARRAALALRESIRDEVFGAERRLLNLARPAPGAGAGAPAAAAPAPAQ